MLYFSFSLSDIELSVKTLTLITWQDEEGKKQRFKLIEMVSTKWKEFGIRTGKNMNQLEGLERQYFLDFRACWCKVMEEWLNNDGTSDYPAKWQGLFDMLDDIDFKGVAKGLYHALCMAAGVRPPVDERTAFECISPLNHFIVVLNSIVKSFYPAPEETAVSPDSMGTTNILFAAEYSQLFLS